MDVPRTSLDEWVALSAVASAGSFARAGEMLNKSQSSISYTLCKLQERLDVRLLEPDGRRSVLTRDGQALLGRAHEVLEEFNRLERFARHLSDGWEAEVCLALDGVFPTNLLLEALSRFRSEVPQTMLKILETPTSELSADDRSDADIIVGTSNANGHTGEPLMQLDFLAVSHPDHPLQKLGRPAQEVDTLHHTQIATAVTHSLPLADKRKSSIAPQWTVLNVHTAIAAVVQNLGFAWLPRHMVQPMVEQGKLKILPLAQGGRLPVHIYLRFTKHEFAGPAARALEAILRSVAAR